MAFRPLIWGIASVAVVVAAVSSMVKGAPREEVSEGYEWSNVAMGGGGATPGLVLHPKVPDLAYIRTDVGGCYRWDAAAERWVPLLDSIPFTEWNLYGVDSLAVDPSDETGNTVYISTGKYTEGWAKPFGMMMKSTDRGTTWKRLPLTPTGASNADQGRGERIAVDPHNGRHVVYAARLGGLFESIDGGESWWQIETAPLGAQPNDPDQAKRGNGLSFSAFDPSRDVVTGPDGEKRTGVLYIGATRDGVYRTQDGGATWQRLEGGPQTPLQGVIGRDGSLVVSAGNGLFRFHDEQWTKITPPMEGGCQAVAIDPADPTHILASVGYSHNAGVFSSKDGGKTWRSVLGKRNQTAAWWPSWHWFSNPYMLVFDPFVPGRVWATDWYGTYRTDDIHAASPVWTNYVKGHEEIVTIGALVAPASGRYRLLSGCADVGGMDHESLTEAPAETIWNKGIPGGMSRTGIAVQQANPKFMASVFIKHWNDPGMGAYSLDGGASWKVFPKMPEDKVTGGRVALPGRRQRIFWLPQKRAPFYSDDLGKSWQPVRADRDLKGAARGDGIFVYDQPLAVDLANPDRVYLFHHGRLLVSTDAGSSFRTVRENLPDGGANKLATPGVQGEVWMAAGDKGLLRSSDGGKTIDAVRNVERAQLFCFGKPPPGKSFPAVFVQGRVNGIDGYFRSDDAAATWTQIDTPSNRVGNDPNTMTGDWRAFGGVFVGTNGRGIFYGRPASAE